MFLPLLAPCYFLLRPSSLKVKRTRHQGHAYLSAPGWSRHVSQSSSYHVGSPLGYTPHNFSSKLYSVRSPLFLHTQFLALKATSMALEPFSLSSRLILSVIVEYPLCFLLVRSFGLSLFYSWHVILRPLVTLIVVCLRRKVLKRQPMSKNIDIRQGKSRVTFSTRGSLSATLFSPFKAYRPNQSWIIIFGSILALSMAKGLASTDGNLARDVAMERMINLTFLPYFVCILAQMVAVVYKSNSLSAKARLFLDYAGVFLPMSRSLIGIAFLSSYLTDGLTKTSVPSSDSGLGLGLWYKWEYTFVEWQTYSATCLVSKILFALFEPSDLRSFVIISLGVEAPILIGMLYFKIHCTLSYSLAFGLLTNVTCIVVGVLYHHRCCWREASQLKKED